MTPPSQNIGSPIIELQQVESTNNYATALVREGLSEHGCVVWAHHQTAGKGQRHKQWLAEAGENITMSTVLQPVKIAISQSFLLSMAMALGVHRFFTKYAGSETKVKWPNDLYWHDRKAGGILIENLLIGTEWQFAVVGTGINVNQASFGGLGQRAVSLKQITGRQFEIKQLIGELCGCLQEGYDMLMRSHEEVVDTYHSLLYKKGEIVRLKKGSRVFDAVVQGVSPLGELIVEHGVEERFAVGEVEWII